MRQFFPPSVGRNRALRAISDRRMYGADPFQRHGNVALARPKDGSPRGHIPQYRVAIDCGADTDRACGLAVHRDERHPLTAGH